MRHQRKTIKLGRSQSHRDALLANLAVNLIEHERIKTTLAKAKAVRPFMDKLVTKAKRNTLHARRMALADLMHNVGAVKKLFAEIGPRCAARPCGYTRIMKLGPRKSDSAPMALIEWCDQPVPAEPIPEPKPAKKAAKKTETKAAAPAAESAPAAEAAPAEENKKPARKSRAKKADEGKAE